jgi:hypothetical protein
VPENLKNVKFVVIGLDVRLVESCRINFAIFLVNIVLRSLIYILIHWSPAFHDYFFQLLFSCLLDWLFGGWGDVLFGRLGRGRLLGLTSFGLRFSFDGLRLFRGRVFFDFFCRDRIGAGVGSVSGGSCGNFFFFFLGVNRRISFFGDGFALSGLGWHD